MVLTEHIALLSKKMPEELSEMTKMDVHKTIAQNHQVLKAAFDSGIVGACQLFCSYIVHLLNLWIHLYKPDIISMHCNYII